jgi:multicomponent Na+:H+ antiporter subunit G
MEMIADIASWLFLIPGCALLVIGALGILRLPDLFARMHAAGIIDTLGIGLIILGLAFQAGWSLLTVKLLFVLAFVFFTSPTTTHALARAALHGGVKPFVHDGQEGESSKT